MMSELIANMGSSTAQGFVGVGLIFVYFCIIVGTAFWRIKRGEHMHH